MGIPRDRHVQTTLIAVVTLSLVASAAGAQSRPFHVLQPLADHVTQMRDSALHAKVFYVPTMLDYVRWGRLPDRTAKPAVTVPSGSLVTFDVVSHEGLLEDQGRDPVRFFGAHGYPRAAVLDDAVMVARSAIPHDYLRDGPHVVSPPVAVAGAERGDILRIDIVALAPRVPYGVNSIRYRKGTLPELFATQPPDSGASPAHPELYHTVSTVIPIHRERGAWVGVIHTSGGRDMRIPLHPFVGTMGVAVDTADAPNSIPPGAYGGNIDLRHLVVGSTLYLPVRVPGALFYMSDSHFNEGNGEVDLTAIEGSLRATVRLTLIRAGTRGAPFGGHLTGPFAETPDYWIPIGLDPDLNVAMRKAVEAAVDFLVDRFGITPTEAYTYLSVDSDFDVTEVVDITKGVHGLLPKRELAADFTPTTKHAVRSPGPRTP